MGRIKMRHPVTQIGFAIALTALHSQMSFADGGSSHSSSRLRPTTPAANMIVPEEQVALPDTSNRERPQTPPYRRKLPPKMTHINDSDVPARAAPQPPPQMSPPAPAVVAPPTLTAQLGDTTLAVRNPLSVMSESDRMKFAGAVRSGHFCNRIIERQRSGESRSSGGDSEFQANARAAIQTLVHQFTSIYSLNAQENQALKQASESPYISGQDACDLSVDERTRDLKVLNALHGEVKKAQVQALSQAKSEHDARVAQAERQKWIEDVVVPNQMPTGRAPASAAPYEVIENETGVRRLMEENAVQQ